MNPRSSLAELMNRIEAEESSLRSMRSKLDEDRWRTVESVQVLGSRSLARPGWMPLPWHYPCPLNLLRPFENRP